MEGTEPATKAAASRRVLKIVSKCSSEAEFLAVFHRFCDHESLFVVTKTPKPVGATSRLAITLAGGKPMLVGEGTVIESSNDTDNALGRPGMRIRFTELDGESRETLAKLNETRAAAAARAGVRGPTLPAAKNGRATIMTPAVPPPTAAGTPPPSPLPGAPIKIPEIPQIPKIPKVGAPAPRSATERKPTRGGTERLASPRVLAAAPRATKSEPAPRPGNGVPIANVPPAKSEPTATAPSAASSQADDDAPTNVSPSAARAQSELTVPSSLMDNPMGEVRAEGSDFILPANPLGELTDESLEAFVECTLYEETGTIAIEPEPGPADDESLPPWWPRGGDGTHTPLPPAAPGMLPPGMDNTGEVPLGRAPTPPPVAFGPGYGAMQGEPTAAGVLAPAFEPFRQRSPWLPIALTAAGTAMITLLVGYLLWGRAGAPMKERVVAAPPVPAKAEPAPPAKVETAPPVKAVATTESAAATAEEETEAEVEAEAETEAAPAAVRPDRNEDAPAVSADVGEGECKLSVTTDPDGARVYADGRALPGKTPMIARVPCEAKVVDIKRSRYEDVRRHVAPAAGRLTEVAVRMQRPKVQLRLVSYPAGATVSIGGRRVGTAPMTATVDGFLYTNITFEKSGYKKSSQRIYPKSKLTLVKGRLDTVRTAGTR